MNQTSKSSTRDWTTVLGVLLAFGVLRCSVYDPSLLTGSESSEVGQAGTINAAGARAGDGAGEAGDSASGGASAGGAPSVGGTGASAGDGTAGSMVDEAGTGGQVSGGGGVAGGVGGAGGTAGSAGAGGSAPVLHELAVGKLVTVSTQETAHPGGHGNDGNQTSRWAASTAAMPQWWQVDLGASHPLEQLSLRFEYADRTYSYIVETSQNGAVYTQQATVNGVGAVQMVDLTGRPSARYVRITVTKAVSPKVGETPFASFWEASLLGL